MAYTMKNSGVEWMGDIPAHWEVKRLKDCANENNSQLQKIPESMRYVDISSVSYLNGIHTIQYLNAGDIPSRARKTPKKDDVIISNVRTYLKAIAKVTEDGLVVSTGFSVFTSKKKTNTDFLYYCLQSDDFMSRVNLSSKGISYPAITGHTLKNLLVVSPPLTEQQAIAQFLDDRTSAIDSKIEALKEKEDSLAQLRKSIIHEAVTKGLDPKVPMKASGVEWIGDIPAHWEVTRGGDVFKIRQGYPFDSSFFVDEGFPVVRMGDFETQHCSLYYKDVSMVPSSSRVEKGTILMGLSGSIKTTVWNTSPAYLNQRVAALDVRKIPHGLARYLSQLMAAQIELELAATTIKNVSTWKILKFVFPKAPLKEQRAIAAYLDERTSVIDQSIDTVQNEIDALQELRKSLIHEAVTGKLDVADFGYTY